MSRVEKLRAYLQKYYAEHGQNLLFHGWHHIVFVTDKAIALAEELHADVETVAAVALVHDLNYLVDTYSRVHVGQALRAKILAENGYAAQEIERIQYLVDVADLQNRGDEELPIEAQIVSDADTLFKALPVTIPVFTARYLAQTDVGIHQVASSIARHQAPLMEKGIYFYTEPYRTRYSAWAEQNLRTWQYVLQALEDNDVRKLLETAGVKI